MVGGSKVALTTPGPCPIIGCSGEDAVAEEIPTGQPVIDAYPHEFFGQPSLLVYFLTARSPVGQSGCNAISAHYYGAKIIGVLFMAGDI